MAEITVDQIWEEYWEGTTRHARIEHPHALLYGGTNREPLASQGMCCFLDPVRDKFKEGFRILDYGCGAGILSNFISARLKDFFYIGIEPWTDHGKERIKLAEGNFRTDSEPRVQFGHIGYTSRNIDKFDTIVLISVLTHLPINKIRDILHSFKVQFELNEDLVVTFSCFIDSQYLLFKPLEHIGPDFYSETHITEDQLMDCCPKGFEIKKYMDFKAQGGHIHNIYTLTKIKS